MAEAERIEIILKSSAIPESARVIRAGVTEAISRITWASVSVIVAEELELEGALGAPAELQIAVDGAPVRRFHLVIQAIRLDPQSVAESLHYTVDLAHELEILAHRADVRMFQEKDAKEIVAAVLDDAGVPGAHLSWSIQQSLVKREYCVQYRESDFAFTSRLLEHEGIFYFAHDDDASTHVTFADAQSAFPPIDGETTISFVRGYGRGLHDLSFETRPIAAQVTLGDHNWTTPSVDLTAAQSIAGGVGDHFEFSAGHKTPAEGAALAKLRAEALLATSRVGRGRSDVVQMRAGAWCEVEATARAEHAGKILVTEVSHHWSADGYINEFTAIPHERQYRPPRVTPRPVLRGVHSAVVTGPSGGEIHTEAMGRMKGHFFWDRVGKRDDKSSSWMRLAQLPIDGSMALARVDWEMAVTYVDGDPDRPVAIARLYNAEKTSPYAHPAAKTRMSLQTASSPGGGKTNEIRMEDGGGGMEMFVNASKDMVGQTNNNKTETITANEKLTVGTDCVVQVGADETISIGANESMSVSAEAGVTVKTDRTKLVGGSETVSVSGSIAEVVEGSDTETTGGSHTTLAALGVEKSSSATQALTVGGSMISAAGTGVSFMLAGAKSETIGAVKLVLSGKSVAETVAGALATTVGGVLVQAAAGNRVAATKGAAAITVGGVAMANGGSKVMLKGKKVSINVLGVANLLGGGGILNLTPASAAFVGLVTLDASGSITLSGNPNLVG